MRRAGSRKALFCAASGWLAAGAAAEQPVADFALVEVPISAAAVAEDPALADARCFDFVLVTTSDWTTTSQEAVIATDGAFYEHQLGSNGPASHLWEYAPALEFDCFWSAPGFVTPAFAGPIVTEPQQRSADWFDVTTTSAGAYTLARFTVIGATTLRLTGNVTVAATTGTAHEFDLTAAVQPTSRCPADPVGDRCDGDFAPDGGDCVVDDADIAALLEAYGTVAGDDAYYAAADLSPWGDSRGRVDFRDLQVVLADYGSDCR